MTRITRILFHAPLPAIAIVAKRIAIVSTHQRRTHQRINASTNKRINAEHINAERINASTSQRKTYFPPPSLKILHSSFFVFHLFLYFCRIQSTHKRLAGKNYIVVKGRLRV